MPSSRVKRPEDSGRRILAVKAVFYLLLLQGAVVAWIPWFLVATAGGRFDPGPLRYGGLPFMLSGAAGLLWCAWDFLFFGRGTLALFDPPPVFVRRGLYSYIRNPMYLSDFSLLLGETLFFGSKPLVIWLLVAVAGFHLLVVFHEEPSLRRRFRESYEAYLREVPRWVPR